MKERRTFYFSLKYTVPIEQQRSYFEKRERVTFPSAVRADSAIFRPSRRTFLFSLIAWLRGLGPCMIAPPLNCYMAIKLFKVYQNHLRDGHIESKKVTRYLISETRDYLGPTQRSMPCSTSALLSPWLSPSSTNLANSFS